VTEHELMQRLILAFGTHPCVRLFRQNSGKIAVRDARGTIGRVVQAGPATGCGDLTGLTAGGRRVEVEVKSAAGRMRPEQTSWGEFIRRWGGVYVVVRVDPALDAESNVRRAVAAVLAAAGYT
jgi:hypothetical protein